MYMAMYSSATFLFFLLVYHLLKRHSETIGKTALCTWLVSGAAILLVGIVMLISDLSAYDRWQSIDKPAVGDVWELHGNNAGLTLHFENVGRLEPSDYVIYINSTLNGRYQQGNDTGKFVIFVHSEGRISGKLIADDRTLADRQIPRQEYIKGELEISFPTSERYISN